MDKQKQQAIDAVNEAIELLKPLVRKIESSLPTTKNHYGDYMSILSQHVEPEMRKKVAAVLVLAGANKSGVAAALGLLS